MDENESQPASASPDQEQVPSVGETTPVEDEEEAASQMSNSNLEDSSSAPPQQQQDESQPDDAEDKGGDDDAVHDDDESVEAPVNINIEDQLKEFEGSDDEAASNKGSNDAATDALCDGESSKVGDESVNEDTENQQPEAEEEASHNESGDKDAFEEVDMGDVEKDKMAAAEENDVLSDDRTQAESGGDAKEDGGDAKEDSGGDQQSDEDEENESHTESRAESRISRMEVDGEEHVEQNHENDEQQDSYVQDDYEEGTRDEDHENDASESKADEDAGDEDTPAERITPNNDDEDYEHRENNDEAANAENNGDADDQDKANESADVITNEVEMSEGTNKEGVDDGAVERMDVSDNGKESGADVPVIDISEDAAEGETNRDDASKTNDRLENNTDDTHATSNRQSIEEPEEVENIEHAEHSELRELQIKELTDDLPTENCKRCSKSLTCKYKYMQDGEIGFLCTLKCTSSFRALSKDSFHLIARKAPISLVFDAQQQCYVCETEKSCKYRLKLPDDDTQIVYLCGPECCESFIGMNVEKFYKRRRTHLVQELSSGAAEEEKKCLRCGETKKCLYSFRDDENDAHFICDDACFEVLEKVEENRLKLKRRSVRVRDLGIPPEIPTHAVSPAVANPSLVSSTTREPRNLTRTEEEAEQAKTEREASMIRRCGSCYAVVRTNRVLLEWETVAFCNDHCLEKYQNMIGSNCTNCNSLVSSTSMGKYCVRFGFDVRQFCSSHCLDTYKKKSIKECAHCQKDISHDKDGFLAPVGDKSQFKDFCSTACVKKYEDILNPRKKQNQGSCAVCNLDKLVRVDLWLDNRTFEFCSNPCFSAFKFVNNIAPDQCTLCLKYFERTTANAFTLHEDDTHKMFCSRICLTVFISVNRKIVACQWCKVKKYNYDMIMRHNNGLTSFLCSTICLRKFMGPQSLNNTGGALVVRLQKICDQCHVNCNPTFSLAMSDSTSRNFCTQQCVIDFQAQHKRPGNDTGKSSAKNKQPYPVGLPKKLHPKPDKSVIRPVQLGTPVSITTGTQSGMSVEAALSPSSDFGLVPMKRSRGRHKKTIDSSTLSSYDSMPVLAQLTPPPPRPVKKRTIGVQTTESGEMKAQIITVPPPQPQMANKQTMCKPSAEALAMQTRRPTCTVELQTPDLLEKRYFVPVPVPIYVPQPMAMYSMPLPIPVPIPIPIPVPIFIPTTRNTAAGIMKEIKKIQDKMPADPFEAELLMMAEMVADEKRTESDSEPEDAVDNTSVVEYAPEGDDIFQMDLNISSAYDEQPTDIETSMPANAIQQVSPMDNDYMYNMDSRRLLSSGGRKRAASPTTPTSRGRISTTPPNKRHRAQPQPIISPAVEEPIRTPAEPAERPDANMCLKYTFGVNAWRQWVMNKNADLEKSTIRRKPFKTELLQLTADELNYSLCLFVKEVRKPNGSEYAPDTIYYLVLGIQQYLYENGRIDNIFTDPYYERFTDCLDDVARKFSVLYNDSQYIVTRVEEEHLWECKQLGAHSPHVLLSTLMFFNTKHFNLTTVDEHMQLSFSHIMKHWKRNNNSGKSNQSTRNVLLRFYPPQTTPDNPRKKKVYEQQENEGNPLRCPVKLYEFYLSKCPESVKTRSDVFYLQPERSCVPDSPVWYSTQALDREALNKMLHRVKMVKEINVALLSSQ